jgi:hypothetical protein
MKVSVYNLSLFNKSSKELLNRLIVDNIISNKETLHMDKEYYMLKYNKKEWLKMINDNSQTNSLINNNINNIGLCRSIIHSDGKILAFSPPKAISEDIFMSKNHPHQCYAEEIIDGTMINLFYDKEIDKWDIATKSSFGARNSFFINNDSDNINLNRNEKENTFRYMFFDVCKTIGFNYKTLPKEYCYSFVFQHPSNRIVIPITEHRLYLIAAYSIDNEKYIVTKLSEEKMTTIIKGTKIMFPQPFFFESFDDIEALICVMNEDYKQAGIMVHHTTTGERTKIINPNYEFVRGLRGNQPKLQYHLLELMQNGKISAYLRYFPEARPQFISVRQKIHDFTEELHTNYIKCYIKKKKPLLDFEKKELHTHMYNLHHKIYKGQLQEKGKHVTKYVVINYVYSLPTPVLMSLLKYEFRKFSESEE